LLLSRVKFCACTKKEEAGSEKKVAFHVKAQRVGLIHSTANWEAALIRILACLSTFRSGQLGEHLVFALKFLLQSFNLLLIPGRNSGAGLLPFKGGCSVPIPSEAGQPNIVRRSIDHSFLWRRASAGSVIIPIWMTIVAGIDIFVVLKIKIISLAKPS
jgi:hypothetical protein